MRTYYFIHLHTSDTVDNYRVCKSHGRVGWSVMSTYMYMRCISGLCYLFCTSVISRLEIQLCGCVCVSVSVRVLH